VVLVGTEDLVGLVVMAPRAIGDGMRLVGLLEPMVALAVTADRVVEAVMERTEVTQAMSTS
jgi:hypothetical protein